MTVSRRDELSRLATPGPVPEVPRAGGDEREESSDPRMQGRCRLADHDSTGARLAFRSLG